MSRTARSARGELADAMRLELEDLAVPGVTIYSSPPEQVMSPALVVAPGRPYRVASAFCAEELVLRIVATVPRSSGSHGLDELDELLDLARRGALRVPGLSWADVDAVGLTIYAGGSEHLSGALNVSIQL